MTPKELIDEYNARNEKLAYTMWKQAYLISLAFTKQFPRTPRDASKELFPKPKTIKMPSVLQNKLTERYKNG